MKKYFGLSVQCSLYNKFITSHEQILINSRDKRTVLKQALKLLRNIKRFTIILGVLLTIFDIRKN